ncbi:hypothetical protein WICPIJ_002758 [Wickerhamomyces pijperi]|uniref:UspA domain-containing protein n=1 Tax=Wickerhamomyces pijperi TaxID=599730 RepID=A0A9P8Q962_WICPI|nr:hypothetical protein WICPIJ_002758 [Wickerhamomyces pijperi]
MSDHQTKHVDTELSLETEENTKSNTKISNRGNSIRRRSRSRTGTRTALSPSATSPQRVSLSLNRLRSRSSGRSTDRFGSKKSTSTFEREKSNWNLSIYKIDPSSRFVAKPAHFEDENEINDDEWENQEESDEEHISQDVDGELYYDVHNIRLPNFGKSINDMYRMSSSAAVRADQDEQNVYNNTNNTTMEITRGEMQVVEEPYISVTTPITLTQKPLPPNHHDNRQYSEVKKYLMVVDTSEESQGSINYVLGAVVKSGDVLYLVHCTDPNDTSPLPASSSLMLSHTMSMTDALLTPAKQQTSEPTSTTAPSNPKLELHKRTVNHLVNYITDTITRHPLNRQYNPVSLTAGTAPFTLTIVIQSLTSLYPKLTFDNLCKFLKPELFIAHYKFIGKTKKSSRATSPGYNENSKISGSGETNKPLLDQFMPDSPLLVLIRRRRADTAITTSTSRG